MSNLSPCLAEAVDLFVMRSFDECFDKCCAVVKAAKFEPEHERNQQVIEASTALGIQALAETNMWEQAVSFITDVYGSVDQCSPHIIQVCILLHAHVKEYLPCHVLVQQWFENPVNRQSKECFQVIRTFASHILHPSGCLDTLSKLVENCPSLSKKDKESLLQLPLSEQIVKGTNKLENAFYENIIHHPDPLRNNQLDGENLEEAEDKELIEKIDNLNKANKNSISDVIEYVYKKVGSFLKEHLNPWQTHLGLLLMAVLAVISLFQTQSGDPVSSLGRMVILWRTFFEKLKQYLW